jgi:hypothetical protein
VHVYFNYVPHCVLVLEPGELKLPPLSTFSYLFSIPPRAGACFEFPNLHDPTCRARGITSELRVIQAVRCH